LCNHGCERRNDSLDLHVALSARARIVGASGTETINQGVHMADEDNVKTPLDAMQDTLSRLKEMEHYSKTNIEKLATLWLEVSEHKEQKQYETMVDEVLKCQNRFQESITSLIEAYEEETARLTSSTQ
jgi:alpha-D-ribose 1-methylphosphonate 5-triphosphate diphosphatase PhnM